MDPKPFKPKPFILSSPTLKESLYTEMEQAHSQLQARGTEVDTNIMNIIAPARDAYVRAASAYPLSTLFLSAFSLLAIFPLVSFIGFCLFAGSIIVAVSIIFFVFWTAVIVGSAALFLLSILSLALGVSIAITTTAGAASLGYRTVKNIRDTGSLRLGLRSTISESAHYLPSRNARDSSQEETRVPEFVQKRSSISEPILAAASNKHGGMIFLDREIPSDDQVKEMETANGIKDSDFMDT